jgi:hypothetical protein
MRKQEYRYATLSMSEDEEIVFAIYAQKLEITLNIAQEMVQDRIEFSSHKPHYILIDFSNVKSVTKEARDFMNSKEGGLKGILGGAFLSSNVVATLFINLFLKVSPPAVPARFFTNKAEALSWINKTRSEKLSYKQIIGA